MFKRLSIIIFISLFVFGPVFTGADDQKLTKEQAIAEMQKTQVQIEVGTPYRDGNYAYKYGSGTVIAKIRKEEDTVYFIHINPHIVDTLEIALKYYKEARIEIYILGNYSRKAEAEIVAWNWRTAGLLLQAEISEHELKNFEFKVAKIANKLPISSTEEKFSDNLLADYVYLGGYPRIELADSRGKVSKYVYSEQFGSEPAYHYILLKTMHIAAEGLVGSGQSGGGIFIINEKTGEPEWVGTTTLAGGQLIIGVPIDVTVEAFLKHIPELKGLINFPKFKFSYPLQNSFVINYKELKQKDNK